MDLRQELLMALRANDADGYKSWLTLGIEQLGRDVAAEAESEWMLPLLLEEERDRLMAWQLGVSPEIVESADELGRSLRCSIKRG